MRWCSVCSRNEFLDWLVLSAMGKFWKHSWKHSAIYLSAWFRSGQNLLCLFSLTSNLSAFAVVASKDLNICWGKKRDLRMCGVTKVFLNRCDPEESFCASREILPRSWSLHASPVGSVLSRLLYCTVKQWTSTHSSAALRSSDENADSLRMQSYSFQRQVWVPVYRCCPSSLTGLGFTRWARLAGSDSEATFPALGFPVSLCGSWGLPRVLVPAWPAIAPASHSPPPFKLYWMSLCIPGWPWISL